MPSLIDFRRRIRSVKNTQQITKAMKMVSAAKLRRAQDAVIAARPFGNSLRAMLANVATASKGAAVNEQNPLLAERPEERVQVIVISSDRGLAGAFSTNLNKAAQKFCIEDKAGRKIEIEAVGKKAKDYFRRRNFTISGEIFGVTRAPKYSHAADIAKKVIERYTKGEIDSVYVAYNEFKSVSTQKPDVMQILPVPLPQSGDTTGYIFEQPVEQLLETLLPRYVEVLIFRAILESTAAEHAARMTAMDAASSNAADVIEKLTLYMNRVRQASITREIIEVVSGASALE
ncbi:MAG: ATP synthase F1 subunit gamma [Acidobacteria bacterium]|nr:ATP synthase F1 subunit gamma [Acidobacteriota bacterium]